jgi:hypothetical protein
MKTKNIVLGFGILIVFALVLWQGIEAFYPTPLYENFCNNSQYSTPYPLKEIPTVDPNCTFSPQLQESTDKCSNSGGFTVYNYDEKGCTISIKYCDTCNKQFTEAEKAHAIVVFWIAIIIGIIVLLVGYSVLSIEPVGSALIASSIWAIFYGTVVNWRNITSIYRFVLLFIALVIIIVIAIKLNTQKEKQAKSTNKKNK